MKHIILFCIFLLLCGIAVADTDITSTNNADARIDSGYPHANYGGLVLHIGDNDNRKTVVNFTLPSGSGSISEIKLCMWRYASYDTSSASNISIYNLTGTFTESEVDWTNRSNGVAWTSAGGDCDGVIIDTINMTASGTTTKWVNWTIRGTDAENSYDSLTWGDTASFLLNQSTVDWRRDYFRSKENGSAYVPFLEITYSGGGSPSITSYAPASAAGNEIGDSQLFNVTVNQTTSCYWYHNGTLVETDSANTEHAYTNTSMAAGVWNITADVGCVRGNDTKTWIFEVGADSIDTIILYEDDTNLSCLSRWNVTWIGSNVAHINYSYSNTTNGYTYYLKYDNDAEILNQTATADDQELWFNHTSLLPVGIYKITGTVGYNDIILAANTYGFLCEDPSIAHPFNMIAPEFNHEICFSWLNNSGECWEFYWSGDAYNSDLSIPKHDAYFVLIDGYGETVQCGVGAAETVAIPTGWYGTYLRESTPHTLAEIKTDLEASISNPTVTNLYTWDHNAGGTGAWVSVDVTPSHSVLPNQGILIHNIGAPYNWDGTVS